MQLVRLAIRIGVVGVLVAQVFAGAAMTIPVEFGCAGLDT